MKVVERMVIVTWHTPEEKTPPNADFIVVTVSGTAGVVKYDHAIALASWDDNDGWWFPDIMVGENDSLKVLAWCDLEPYGGGK